MLGLLTALARAWAVRPLWWWLLALLIYAVVPLPSWWALWLLVGLGVALAVSVARLRERGRRARYRAAGAWTLVERLARAVEDRIRGHHAPPEAGYPPADSTHAYVNGTGLTYDPGALLTAIAAVLAAEGLATDAAPAMPTVVRLLAHQGIQPCPGQPAPTAHRLAALLHPGAPRPHRLMPPALLAEVIQAILTHDHALTPHITPEAASVLLTDSARILRALSIHPADQVEALEQWPVIARILHAASLSPHNHDHGQWGRS